MFAGTQSCPSEEDLGLAEMLARESFFPQSKTQEPVDGSELFEPLGRVSVDPADDGLVKWWVFWTAKKKSVAPISSIQQTGRPTGAATIQSGPLSM